ncbi:MAG: hypothetical protein WAM14_08185 [Candidatus Nitrosopolaris sp.]
MTPVKKVTTTAKITVQPLSQPAVAALALTAVDTTTGFHTLRISKFYPFAVSLAIL